MRIELPSGTPAELVVPDNPVRGLVLAPDIMGLRPLFDRLCSRLADEQRWAVCSPEPFPGREDMPLEDRLGAVGSLSDDAVLGDLVAAADHLGTERTAVLGFCMGGMYALKAAGTGRFDRAVAFYGMIKVPENWRSAGQGEPLDALRSDPVSPVLAIIGSEDPYTPPADVAELQQLPNVEAVVYQGAEHGFVHDPDRPSHRADDAADAWRRVAAFLA